MRSMPGMVMMEKGTQACEGVGRRERGARCIHHGSRVVAANKDKYFAGGESTAGFTHPPTSSPSNSRDRIFVGTPAKAMFFTDFVETTRILLRLLDEDRQCLGRT